MRTIIAGSRNCQDPQALEQALAVCNWSPTVVLSGAAPGADRLGEQWAQAHGVPLERFPSDWRRYGRGAGRQRNSEMAEQAEALIALWDGRSSGTQHMIRMAGNRGLRVYVHRITPLA